MQNWSEILSTKGEKVLTSFIQADQMAYVKDRYIDESVRLINDIQIRIILKQYFFQLILRRHSILFITHPF